MTHWMVLKIALRNIFLHRMRTLVVGLILILGGFLAIVGNSFVSGVADGMQNSTTQSISGDIQIYSEDAKDKLSVFGNMDGSPTDVGHVDHFTKVSEALMKNPHIESIIPMGTNFATINPSNILDHFLETLRKSFKDPKTTSADIESQKRRLRFLIEEIRKNLDGKFDEIGMLSPKDVAEANANLKTVSSDIFWRDFNANYENKIEFLANKIAPLIFDNNMIFFNYVGTDPQLFKEKFKQFEIVKGEMIPEGQRGLLFHDYFYETYVKHRIARRLDQIKKKMKDDKLTIKDSKELQDSVKANVEQSAEIYLQLGPAETEAVAEKLRQEMKTDEKDFRVLIKNYLDMNGENFQARYDFFYKEIAPHVVLYRVKVGENLPLSAFTKAGSSTAVNIKVYGTFRFKSFENSPLAGNFSVMDLVSLRELYGFMTAERREQNKALEAEMGLNDVGQESIEDLFSSGNVETTAKTAKIAPVELSFKKRVMDAGYTKAELDNGIFLNAAIFLKDSRKISRVVDEINEQSKKEGLGIKAVSWQDATGFIGQMTFMMKAVLNMSIGIVLMLAGLMITNSLLMAAMNRKQEIGTMRAIGAHASFIYRLFFFETLIMSVIFGGAGVLLGSLVVLYLGKVGIPASGDVATFFFSGPKLFLSLSPFLVVFVIFAMILIALFATQYPAWKAMKISPLQAMQKRE